MGINVNDYKKFKEKTIPPGWYGAKITEVKADNSKKTGAAMGVISCQLIDDAPMGADVDMDKYLNPLNTFHRFYVVTPDTNVDLTPAQYDNYGLTTKKFIKACGFNDITDVLNDDNEIDWKLFLGQELDVKIKLEPAEDYPDGTDEDDKEFRANVAYGGFREPKL